MGASSNGLSINQGVIGHELEENQYREVASGRCQRQTVSEHVHAAPLLVAGKADLNIDDYGQPDSGST